MNNKAKLKAIWVRRDAFNIILIEWIVCYSVACREKFILFSCLSVTQMNAAKDKSRFSKE